ncbi:MAG: hypothetical protein EB079_05030 [Verrucomicrobia bacterium]|nr:hypothetical protein [Verrucomicrobiota bacterium]
MEIYRYYNLDECVDRKLINKTLKSYQKEGKIDYSIDRDILTIEDIELDDDDIQYLSELFEENSVFADTDRNDDDDSDDDYFPDYDDDYNDDY